MKSLKISHKRNFGEIKIEFTTFLASLGEILLDGTIIGWSEKAVLSIKYQVYGRLKLQFW